MSPEHLPERDVELARELIMELVRTGLMLADALGSLIEDLPEEAYPGEDKAEVLLGMAAGSCAPVIGAAGEHLCADALALMTAIGDRFLDDLREAARRAAP